MKTLKTNYIPKKQFMQLAENNIKIPEWDCPPKDSDAYSSNNSVSLEVAKLFYNAVMKYKKMVIEFVGKKKEIDEKINKLTANILTHELKIIVRHDRWLYFFNGKYYERLTEQELCCKIRELVENAAIHWTNFSCGSTTSRNIMKNILEVAIHVDYPKDISKYIIMILSISLDTFSTQNSKQVRNQLFEMEQIYMERSGMDICSISVAA